MNMPEHDGLWALTDKEKQTLRLIVRGHDAKSIARSLGLSVHTINERLRDARRKMTVSSSREAARMLLQAEGGGTAPSDPESFGAKGIGEDAGHPAEDQDSAPFTGAGRPRRSSWIILGVCLMTIMLAVALLAVPPQATSNPPSVPTVASPATNPEVVDAARRFLTLVDQSRWNDSYQATGTAFRKLNTVEAWTRASNAARVPLGAVVSRTFLSEEFLPAPPSGYDFVKFRTSFANKAEQIETVSLEREDGQWRIVGVTIG